MKPIPYGRQHISDDDISVVEKVLRSDFLTQGPKVQQFEGSFAQYIGCKYAVAVSNGTAALHLSALALCVNEKSKVITTPIGFAASANCVRYCGGEVIFADIDRETVLLDINNVKALLERFPQGTYCGIIPVDLAGYPIDMEAFRKLADEYGLWIIEDACHAPGGYFIDSNGRKQNCGNGTYADLAVFSFHPVKHITCGEGGMITTNNKKLYDKLIILRTHGITKDPGLLNENHGGWYYEMQMLGYNYRLSDMHAALGFSQLERADKYLRKRIDIARTYDKAFKDYPVKTISVNDNWCHALHLYIIQVERRAALYDHLRANNIFAQVHYIPIHLQPYYQRSGFKKGDFTLAEAYYEQCLSLPMYPSLSKEEQNYVIDTLLNFF
ncbi:MAG: UDP-4-amino-4,6-dideoxy-N-acetyl-beta-L-altrosamine transaminase [Cytophagales bacterium]|nr:UDP-4-amino-4,6-dideoxy-N-acetyl-beta-L-altrosamine transaminase [Cytophagales bacterium]